MATRLKALRQLHARRKNSERSESKRARCSGHLARSQEPYDGHQRLYVIDESSLASTKQMNEFLRRLKDNDRVLLVGDIRQHQAVEAGTPYQQLQEARVQTARRAEIIRQKDPELTQVARHLSRGPVKQP